MLQLSPERKKRLCSLNHHNNIHHNNNEEEFEINQNNDLEKHLLGRSKSELSVFLYQGLKQNQLQEQTIFNIAKFCDLALVDEDGNSFLHWACWYKKSNIVYHLCYLGININILNHIGQPALHWAVTSGDIKSAKILIDAGASPMCKDVDGYTLMIVAAQFNHPGMLEFLYFYTDISPLETDYQNRNALHWSAYKNNHICTEWLINHSVDPNVQDRDGNLPLHYSVNHESNNSASILLRNTRSDAIGVANVNGDSPLDIAKSKNRRNSIHLIEERLNRNFFTFFIDCMLGSGNNIHEMEILTAKIGVFFIIQHLLCVAHLRLEIYRYFSWIDSKIYVITYLLGFVPFLTYYLVRTSDPGQLTPKIKQTIVNDEYMALLMNGEDGKICVTCTIVKPLRSKHCPICRKCVAKFDHHCPWIGNCIGGNNQRKFLLHLFLESCSILFYLVFVILFFTEPKLHKPRVIEYFIAALLFTISLPIWIFCVSQMLTQMFLISTSLTMNESINSQKYSYLYAQIDERNKNSQEYNDPLFHNPFHRGCFINWIAFCFWCIPDKKFSSFNPSPPDYHHHSNSNSNNQNKKNKNQHCPCMSSLKNDNNHQKFLFKCNTAKGKKLCQFLGPSLSSCCGLIGARNSNYYKKHYSSKEKIRNIQNSATQSESSTNHLIELEKDSQFMTSPPPSNFYHIGDVDEDVQVVIL